MTAGKSDPKNPEDSNKYTPCVLNGKKHLYGQKPVKMMEFIIERVTVKKGLEIVDPFMGVGTTG